MLHLVLNILLLALFVNWIVQMVAIYGLSESHFRQPSDRILWFIVVVVLFPVGAVIFLLWNQGRSRQIREDQEHRARQERIARRVEAARGEQQP